MRLLTLLFFVLFCCSVQANSKRVYTGLEVFLGKHSAMFKGKRVALLTNQTGLDYHGRSNIDLFHKHPNIKLVKLFSPEHGIRGEYKAGKEVANSIDRKTLLPIYSLYGRFGFKPKAAHLKDVDVLFYDIQDVGSRAYTYIWSLAECMEACAEFNIPVVVLDRPCPFGAMTIDGPMSRHLNPPSLLTKYSIPRVYGMTVGELARYFKRSQGIKCKLYVIPMMNYKRGMSFKQTGHKWVAPSPNIPNIQSALSFPVTGTIGNLGELHIGIKTSAPFQLIAAPWLDAKALADWLNQSKHPGVKFSSGSFSPKVGFMRGKNINYVHFHVHNASKFRPSTLELCLLYYLHHKYPKQFKWNNAKTFDRAMGTSMVRRKIIAGRKINTILADWQAQQSHFKKLRQECLIY